MHVAEQVALWCVVVQKEKMLSVAMHTIATLRGAVNIQFQYRHLLHYAITGKSHCAVN